MPRTLTSLAIAFALLCFGATIPLVTSQTPALGQSPESQEDVVRLRGFVGSGHTLEVRSKVPGQARVSSFVSEGKKVKKGDVVVRLDATKHERSIMLYQTELAQAKAKLRQAEMELHSAKLNGDLRTKIAERELELAESNKSQVLGEDGELAVEAATVEGERVIARARLQAAEFLLPRVESDPIETEEVKVRITEARETLRIAEARLRLLTGVKRRHETLLCNLQITRAAAELEQSRFRTTSSVEAAKAVMAAQQADVERASVTLERAKDALQDYHLVAPQDGVVMYPGRTDGRIVGFQMKVGAVTRERQTLFHLVDMSQLQLKLRAEQADIHRLKAGQSATIQIDAFPNQTWKGKVERIRTEPTPPGANALTFEVIVSIESPPSQAKIGLTAEASISTSEE